MALFNILVDIAARTASLESGINNAVAGIERLTAVAESAKAVLERTFVGISFVGLVDGLASTVEGIEAIGRAAEKASITVEAFSALDYVAKQVGVSTEALSKGFKFMEKAIADAGDGVAKPLDALEKLGVDLDKLQKMSPDKQFETLAEAINRVKDPAQKMQIELALFGRAGNDLAPVFAKGAAGIEELIEKAKEMGLVLSTEQTAKATEAAESIKSLHASWTAFTRTLATETAPALTKIADGMRKMLGGATDSERIAALKTQMSELRAVIDPLLKEGSEQSLLTAQPYIERFDAAAAALARLTGASSDARGTIQRNLAEVNDAIGKPFNTTSIEDLIEWMKSLKGHLALEKIPTDHLEEFFHKLDEETRNATEKTQDEARRFRAALDELLNAPDIIVRGKGGGITETIHTAISQDEASRRWLDYLDKILPDIQVKAKMMKDTVRDTMTFADEMMKSAAHSIQQSMANFLFDPFSKGVRGMVAGFVNAIRRMVAELAANQILKNFFGFSGDKGGGGNTGFAGLLQSFIGGLFGGSPGSTGSGSAISTTDDAEQALGILPGYASGGSISGPSWVGEDGPEIFVPPGGGGSIIPNNQIGGSSVVHAPTYNINVDARSDRVQVIHEITTLLKHAQRETVSLIMDTMNRNGFQPMRY